MHSNDPLTGLTLLRASRLEALLDPLAKLLRTTMPDNPLAPQTVIAAHPGMKQWLAGAMARQAGPGRVVANLEVLLPSAWLDGLSSGLLGERAVALPQYRRGHLRWTLHAMLGAPGRHGVDDPRLLSYLESAGSEDERALRRFQLADQLARVYSQYLVYRADWLQAWEAGKASWATARLPDPALKALETRCLAPLWKAAVAALGEHRGMLVGALVNALGHAEAEPPPLHVFGVSHLPPAELEVIRAYSRRAPVFLYVPDPCREYWGGLHAATRQGDWRLPDADGWAGFRDDESARLADPEAIDWQEQEHPLLARWGRLGQHFFAALVEGDVREDMRHGLDDAASPPGNRLQRLQESIRRLEPELMAEDPRDPAAPADSSLRIHACHTRLRELEVLRDALLDAVEHDAIRPGNIVVMAPDIRAYLPLIPAVFGEAGSLRERRLPYHLADVPVARSHPLFTVVRTLLEVGTARITAPAVVDLLGVAEVRRALGLGAGEADELVEWLRASRVAWGLDGAHKASMSLPARAENTFAWALDRMLAGYLMADAALDDDAEATQLPDGTVMLPLAGIEGPSAGALGSLDRLLRELQAWRDMREMELPASAWAEMLGNRIDGILRAMPGDAEAAGALSAVRRAIAQVAAEPARNGEDPLLRMPVVAQCVHDALEAIPERQRFLLGGITFCGMVPQRAIPFDLVCVLGLDEGAFPRRTSDGGVDLMSRIRRIGDRDVVRDDRYLFLETLMSARKRLHLSFVGQDARDGKPRNPAAPLAELVAELESRACIAPDDRETPRPWQVRHPLQPFDGRYFDGSHPALFSYSGAFAGMSGQGEVPLPRLRAGKPLVPEPLPETLQLSVLQGFFKDPARHLLRDHMRISLDALDADAELPEVEPLDGIDRLHVVARRVFFREVLPRWAGDPEASWSGEAPAWLAHGGLLPAGRAGAAAWEAEAEAVREMLERAKASGCFDRRSAAGGATMRIDVQLPAEADDGPALRVEGEIGNVFPLQGSERGMQVVFAWAGKKGLKKGGDLHFGDLVPAFLHWLLLRLQHGADGPSVPLRMTLLAEDEPPMAALVNAWDEVYCRADEPTRASMEEDLRQRLRGLIDAWRLSRAGQSLLYPRTGWAALKAEQESAGLGTSERAERIAKAARERWVAAFGGGGERMQAPGYARLLEGDLLFGHPETDPGDSALQSLLDQARRIHDLIHLDVPADEGARSMDADGDSE